LKSGKLRHRIQGWKQVLTPTVPDCGSFDETYTIKGTVWAEVAGFRNPPSEEQYHDRSIVQVKQFKIRTRHNIGFVWEPTDIITVGIFPNQTALLRIQAATDILENDYEWNLRAYEIERDSVVFNAPGVFTQEGLRMYSQEGEILYTQAGI